MEKNNTTKIAQPQPGTPATGAVDGGIVTDVSAGRPVPLVTKEPISPVEEEIDKPSLKRVRNEGEPSKHSAHKRVRKESDEHPPTKEGSREHPIVVKEAEIKELVEKIEGCKKP